MVATDANNEISSVRIAWNTIKTGIKTNGDNFAVNLGQSMEFFTISQDHSE